MEQAFTYLRDLTRSFAGALDLVSPDVANHHQRVAYLAFRLAEVMELSPARRQLAVHGALLHDVGSVMLEGSITLENVEGNAARLAKSGAELLRLFSRTRQVSEVVERSQTPWQRLGALPKQIQDTALIGQIIHLADVATLLLGDGDSVLNRVRPVRECIDGMGRKEFHPRVLEAFHRVCELDYVWLDLLYREDLFPVFLPEDTPVSLDGAVQLTELAGQVIDFRSPFTAMHSAGVAAAAAALAEAAGMGEDECKMMRIAGNLHDLGKLKTPKEILEKPGKLTDAEFNVIKEHAYYTGQLLRDIRGFDQITLWASLHHEKLSGTGYPFRLAGSALPLGSRIMAVADVFSAVTEERPYRKGMDREQTVRVLRENARAGALSEAVTEYLIAHYAEIDAARDKASREAGRRYFASLQRQQEEVQA